MKTELFDYNLPEDLIAYYPPKNRDGGRLMVLEPATGATEHKHIVDLQNCLPRGTLLVANDTKVIKARLRGKRPTGGAVEVLLVRELESHQNACVWSCLCKANKSIRPGNEILFKELEARVIETDDRGTVRLSFGVPSGVLLAYVDNFGEIPLPPYIKRSPEPEDEERYQTIFAKHKGSIAAPTAGLHFTKELTEKLTAAGIETAYVTLHVGPGTFKPVASTSIDDHVMDSEVYSISEETAKTITTAKIEGRKVVAVGTTVTRALEGAFAEHGNIGAALGSTSLFIAPGFTFRVIDGLFTNFHLPKSTLICLVSALAGRERILSAYEEAVERRYRFYSYGDAMLISPRHAANQLLRTINPKNKPGHF